MLAPTADATPQVWDCSTSSGLAPASHDNLSCDRVCTLSSNTLTCDLSSCGSGSSATVVEDYGATGTADFSAWGSCATTDFCCAVRDDPSPAIDTVELVGTAWDDSLSFKEGGTNNLKPHRANTNLTGEIHGGDGDDDIDGSRSTSAYYFDMLHGDDGSDDMKAWAGDDKVYGGPGDDDAANGGTVNGGLGNDELHGGDGSDDLYGDDGSDVLYGDDGEDMLSGGAGPDTLFGGADDDHLYGGNDKDAMDGGDGSDFLSGQAAQDAHCDTAVDSGGACNTDTFDDGTGFSSNDHFWYEFDAYCSTNGGQPVAFDAGGGTDACGDSAWNTTAFWPWVGCNGTNLTIKPSTCP